MLEELIPGGESYLYAENLYGLQWWGDECIKPGIDTLYSVQPQTGKEEVLFTREQVNKALASAGYPKLSHLYDLQFLWDDKTEVLLPRNIRYAVYNWKKGEVIGRDDLPKEPSANYDYAINKNLAYTVKNNLYVNGRQITNEPEVSFADNLCTATNSVSTKEPFGVRKAICSLSTIWTKVW